MKKTLLNAFASIVLITALPACSGPESPGADRVFINGAVYTADESHSWAEAVAINGGAIVFVGSDGDAVGFIGSKTEVVDLDGKMLMPGFHDGHAHVQYGGRAALGCNLMYELDVSKIRGLLAECLRSREYGPDDWVIGGGWPLAAFPDGNPSAAILDEILEGRPAYFSDAFGHNGWASSRALELAGIDMESPDPSNGVIVRDAATGKPSGTLRENAMALIEDVLPVASEKERYGALLAGLQQARAFGITAFVEPGVAEDKLSLYRTADRRGDLTARVLASLSPINELAARFGPEIFDLLAKRDDFRGAYLDVDSVKVYIDGVIETRTSFMLEPYLDGSNSPPFYEQDELNALYERFDAMGLQIHTHAIGDGAIRAALDAYEHALFENGPNDNRHQIVHLQLIDEEDIPRFAELNVAANFQCMWCYPDVYIDLAVDIVGEERVEKFYPVRSIEKTGARLVGGSDWDVSSLNPLDAIETAVRRQDPFEESDRTLGKGEEIDLASALDMYTRNAAYVMRLEDKTGSIEVGKRADLIVIDRNLFEVPVSEINEARVLLTIMDGKTVYSVDETYGTANQRAASESEKSANYEITITEDNRQIASVKASLKPTDGTFYMFPGANQLPKRWSTFVSDFVVTDENDQPLSVTAMEDGSWQLSAMPQGRVTFSYQVNLEHENHSWSGGVDGAAYMRDWGVFYTARALFIANGEERDDINVEFYLPESWKVTTPWHEQDGETQNFRVADYEALSTSMFFAGTHKQLSITQGKFELLLALGGEQLSAQEKTFSDMAKGVLQYYTDLMGGIPRLQSQGETIKSVVIINPSVETDGEAIGSNISILIDPDGDSMSQTIARFIFAHEFFHLWNGKSFSPNAEDTEWFKEGFSNYYTLKALRHIGYLSDESYLDLLGGFFYQRYDSDDGVGKLSLTNGELKHEHWGLIYAGGMFVAIAQDLQIRSATGNRKSVDDLMRFMYSQFGSSNYDISDIEDELSRLNSVSQEEFFARYIYGTERISLSQYLELANIETRKEDGQTVFKIQDETDDGKSEIRRGLFGR